MSDLDSDDSHNRGRFDLESDNPQYSLMDSTKDLTPLNNRNESDDEPLATTQYRRYGGIEVEGARKSTAVTRTRRACLNNSSYAYF